MDFTVYTADNEDHFDGDSRFAVEGGVLTVYSDAQRVTYSAAYWHKVVTRQSPRDAATSG
jgi:hypothetical protein